MRESQNMREENEVVLLSTVNRISKIDARSRNGLNRISKPIWLKTKLQFWHNGRWEKHPESCCLSCF